MILSPPLLCSPGSECIWGLFSLSPHPCGSPCFMGCVAVQWPPSHPGATQPVKDSGVQGPCQNPIAPHLQSINASHSHSPSPSPTLPQTLTLLHFTLSHLLFTLVFKFLVYPYEHSFASLFWFYSCWPFPYPSLPPCPSTLLPIFYLHPMEKSPTHYVSGSQQRVVAVNSEPQDIPQSKQH